MFEEREPLYLETADSSSLREGASFTRLVNDVVERLGTVSDRPE